MYAQSPLDLPQHRTSHCHEIHLSTSYDHQLNPMADHPWIHPLQLMHDHPDPMVHLGSHQCTRQPTSVCAACLTPTDNSVRSHCTSRHSSSSLAHHTHSYPSVVGHQSLSAKLTTYIGHPTYMYTLVPKRL